MEIIKKIVLSVLILSTLSSCTTVTNSDVKGILVPHHLFVESYIENFYKEISSYNRYDKIILISPNHFGFGYNFVQTSDKFIDSPDNSSLLDKELINSLTNSKNIHLEASNFHKEHGITVHIPFIKKHFPDAKIIPITIKQGTPQKILDQLIEDISTISTDNTLIIASIDFAHLTQEDEAAKSDQRIISWLKTSRENKPNDEIYEEAMNLSLSKSNIPESVAMDSPETIYVTTRLLDIKDTYTFNFWKRTSSSSLTGLSDPRQNTSHIFGWFE